MSATGRESGSLVARAGEGKVDGFSRAIAVALTVKDEGRTIQRLLDALLAQTLRPAEVLITDGGSRDETVRVIQGYIDRGDPVRLLVAPGACRGRGRNLAIAASQCERIALIDGGCFPEPAWLEHLLVELDGPSAKEVVFGAVRPVTDDLFTECVSTVLFPAVSLPGGRRVMSYSVASMLIRRSVWERIGGFVEGFRTGEDLIFVRRIRDGGFRVSVTPSAEVHWEIPRTLRGTVRRLVNYSHYSLEAGMGHTWHYRTFLYCALALLLLAMGLIHRVWWFALLAGLFLLRVVKTILRNEKKKCGILAFTAPRLLLVGSILLAADLATLYGTVRWLRDSRFAQPSRQPL
jgi:cellulose synthase/poly-beta-1,6-N-acetylglucosamine synthase-like glycosyltransferase